MHLPPTFSVPHWAFGMLSAWTPFVTPAPLWDVWWILLVPLVVAVAIVYKTIKVRSMRRLLAEAGQLSVTILVAMGLGALALTLLVKVVLG